MEERTEIAIGTAPPDARGPQNSFVGGCFFSFIMAAVASPAQTLTTLYNFTGGNDGAGPNAPLVQGSDGNFYGTTLKGGAGSCTQSSLGCGTIFQITPQGALSTLSSFGNEGSIPSALIQALTENFMGQQASCSQLFPLDRW